MGDGPPPTLPPAGGGLGGGRPPGSCAEDGPPSASPVGVVIVSWNVSALLDRCLASLAASDQPLRIVVVDNASSDDTVAMLRRRHPRAAVIANADNRGFTAANNQGLRALGLRLSAADGPPQLDALPGEPPPEQVLLLNPDTEVAPDAVSRLLDCLTAHPRAAVAGPALRYGDGSPQPSRRRFPTVATALVESTPIGWHWPGLPPIRRYLMADAPDDGEQRVDWVTGAAMLFRRAALEAAGGLDEGFFMYSEELDLCRRLADLGWETWFCPGARVLHHEGRSSEQVSGLRHRHFQRSRLRYMTLHHGRRIGELLRLGILAQYAVELALEGLKGLLGHRRALRRARAAAYRELLRDGLR
jgi:N-acetylglucosaminyl-diphospho-decaprenol L-rhamnosyltransferase